MRIHFSVVGENTPGFINMIKLLLFSIRKNGGAYSQCPVTVVTIGSSLESRDFSEIDKRFQPVSIVTMPQIGSIAFANKYNAFYAVSKADYDVLVLLDSDTVVLKELDNIVDGMTIEKPFFKARPIRPPGARLIGYKRLLSQYADLKPGEIETYKDPTYLTDYPLFNAGVIVLNQKAVDLIRADTIRIIYRLYESLKPETFFQFLKIRILPNLVKAYYSSGNRVVKLLVGSFLKRAGVWYPVWNCEQIGLSIAVLKHRMSIMPLSNLFNWTFDYFPPNNISPYILHYLRIKKRINLNDLLTGDWTGGYHQNQLASKKALAEMIDAYLTDKY